MLCISEKLLCLCVVEENKLIKIASNLRVFHFNFEMKLCSFIFGRNEYYWNLSGIHNEEDSTSPAPAWEIEFQTRRMMGIVNIYRVSFYRAKVMGLHVTSAHLRCIVHVAICIALQYIDAALTYRTPTVRTNAVCCIITA